MVVLTLVLHIVWSVASLLGGICADVVGMRRRVRASIVMGANSDVSCLQEFHYMVMEAHEFRVLLLGWTCEVSPIGDGLDDGVAVLMSSRFKEAFPSVA